MHNRKMWTLSLVLVLVMVSMSACAMGDAMANQCEPEISTELALEAQNAGMMGMAAGKVEWNESHLSSFLTVLLQQNTGGNFPVEAIKACGVPCHYKPYYGEFDEEPGPPPLDEASRKTESKKGQDLPSDSNDGGDKPPQSDDSPANAPAPGPSLTNVVTPITRLTNLCIVSLANGQQVKPDPQISATHRGRIYYFASEAARQTFVENPERYAVTFGGCDPVHFVRTQQAVEGRFLAEHEGRFFMFATRENHDAFKANPDRYAPKTTQSDRVASNQ